MKQVEKNAYAFESYCGIDRWSSYHYQLCEILRVNPHTMLEVGTGDGVVKQYVQSHTNIQYKNLDIAEDLSPDILGSVDAIPVGDGAFGLVCAFEVLEHLPFDRFEVALRELARVSEGPVLISLPHFGPAIKLLLKVPFLPEITSAFKIPYPRAHVFNGQHYWEIGKRGYPLRHIKEIISRIFVIEEDFVPFENQYHHFFILKKK